MSLFPKFVIENEQAAIPAICAIPNDSELIHWCDCTPEQLNALWSRVKAGEPTQIYSNTLGEAVWWVRDETLADELKRQSVTEVIYTIAELKELAGKPAEFLRDIHQFKERFDATLLKADTERSS